MDFKFIYKICKKTEWLEAKTKGEFVGSKKDLLDGYIHFSNKEQLKDTLDKFFVNQRDLMLLKVEALKLDKLIYEQSSDGNMFPHLYAPLNISYVCNEYEIITNKNGSHQLPF